jgi:hypothetical protein
MNTNPYNWRRVEQKVNHMFELLQPRMSATRLEVCNNQRIVRHSRVIAWLRELHVQTPFCAKCNSRSQILLE